MSRFKYEHIFQEPGEHAHSPMEKGHIGMWFIYLTNRNHCTVLFQPRATDHVFYNELSVRFPMGYSQLYVLEKCDKRHAANYKGSKNNFCAFKDPARTAVGQGAVISTHPSFDEAAHACRAFREETGVDTIVCRVVDSVTWH